MGQCLKIILLSVFRSNLKTGVKSALVCNECFVAKTPFLVFSQIWIQLSQCRIHRFLLYLRNIWTRLFFLTDFNVTHIKCRNLKFLLYESLLKLRGMPAFNSVLGLIGIQVFCSNIWPNLILLFSLLQDCHVLTFSSSGSVSDHLVLHPQLATGNFIIKAVWLPGSQTELAIVTADFVKVCLAITYSWVVVVYFQALHSGSLGELYVEEGGILRNKLKM